MLSLVSEAAVSLTLLILNLLAPLDVRVDKGHAYAAGAFHQADIYRPNAPGPHPVVVFLYGGGWRSGSKEDVAYVGAAFARRGFVTVIPDYRHVPAAGLPDILDDNAAAVAWTLRHATEFAGDPHRVVVVGHSSGAWAAAMLGLDAAWLARAGTSPDALAGVVGLSGPYSVDALTDPRDRQVFAGSDRALQPINHATGPHPAMLLLTGDADRDVRPSGTVALVDKLRRSPGTQRMRIYPGLGHGDMVEALSVPFSLHASVARDVRRFIDAVRAAP